MVSQTLLFLETYLKTYGMSTKTNLMKQEFPLKPVFSQELKILTLESDFTLEITVHIESSINFLTRSLKSIMVMDLMRFTIQICQLKESLITNSQRKMDL